MSKQQLIESIREHNPTAEATFLDAFGEEALYRYLRRLRNLNRPRGMATLWVRPAGTPAVVTSRR